MGKYKRIYQVGKGRSFHVAVVTAYSKKNAEEQFAEVWRELVRDNGPSVKQSEIEEISKEEPTFKQGQFEL